MWFYVLTRIFSAVECRSALLTATTTTKVACIHHASHITGAGECPNVKILLRFHHTLILSFQIIWQALSTFVPGGKTGCQKFVEPVLSLLRYKINPVEIDLSTNSIDKSKLRLHICKTF